MEIVVQIGLPFSLICTFSLLPPTSDREPSPEEDEAGKYTLRQRVRSEDPKKLRTTLKAAQRMALSKQVSLHACMTLAMVLK